MSAISPSAVPSFRGRIGRDARSGYYAAARRYRLHLSVSCPQSLRIAVTHSLLGLGDGLPVTLLPAVPDGPDGGHRLLRPLYEASSHQYPGPAAAPVLHDTWTGRIVSTHTPDILRDLVRQFGAGDPDLLPHGAEEAIGGVDRLCEEMGRAAQRAGLPGTDQEARDAALATLLEGLEALERRLALQDHMAGDELTLADVHVWATLLQLDTVHRHHLDAAAVHRITGHPRLWAYARGLAAHPAFGSHLDLDGIARRHHARCRGEEAAGAAVQIVDWAAYARRTAPEPVRQPG
ncbi:glutathione S-transferase C-terminal domain-containing protein [Streptomyces sp. NPDC002734]|uniref:glutathione S-transferase C-terminal domain-containing protein n=1 Tax=Streptomyces sp. NPDC002734 TaxID=3154426 RepID=UPI0033329BAC